MLRPSRAAVPGALTLDATSVEAQNAVTVDDLARTPARTAMRTA